MGPNFTPLLLLHRPCYDRADIFLGIMQPLSLLHLESLNLCERYLKDQDGYVNELVAELTSRSLVTALTVVILELHRSSLLLTDSLTTDKWLTSKLVLVITSRLGPCRKHRSIFYSIRFRRNVFACEGVTQ
jgi:hypothetical protein